MKISILHPSRSRPDRSMDTIKKWIANSVTDIEIIISLDTDDPYLDRYNAILWPSFTQVIHNVNKSAIDAINKAAEVATGDIFIVVSDDTDCPQEWDQKILNATEGQTDWIAKCPDGIQKWIITMPIMDRAYYNRFKYVYYPGFQHLFCDTFMTCVADLLARRIDLQIPFTHLHHSVGKSVKDALNDRTDATWEQGQKLFIELAKMNFLLSPKEVKGRITDQGILNWMKGRV
jgi:glycosyltransferase involved in cell wall biosynthesis